MIDLAQRIPLVTPYATAHGLDVSLVCAVIEQESGWDEWATRYEPLFYAHYVTPLLDSHTVNSITEALGRATSYGLMQIMGQTAREFGYSGKWLTSLCDPTNGLEYGCRKLADCIKRTSSVHDALQRWNGGSNPTYADQVLARQHTYQQ